MLADETGRNDKLAILQDYLEAVKPRTDNEDALYLGEVMEMWSFAAQVHDEGVLSSVVVVLALLLQVLSDSLHLVPYGLRICQTLLLERHLKLISRNVTSEKSKAFIISPTLRVLREVVCFDGGAFAKQVVRARAYTFASLARNLETSYTGDDPEGYRRASVRTNAVRLLLACLRYLHSDGRKELLSQKDLVSSLTYMLKNDPPGLLVDIIDSLQSYALTDAKVAREVKFRAFNTKVLMRFLGLYTYTHPGASADEKEIVAEKTHQFLLCACANPVAGVLYPYKGLYPKESDDEFSAISSKGRTVATNDDPWEGKLRDGVSVYNFALSEFIGKLKPWSSLKHCQLLVAIFKAAPELIADYFYNNRSFTFEPKLTMTWIGYATFLFDTMMLPLPPAFGDAARYAAMPPPISVLLDNIMPSPINQKILIRSLAPNSRLTSHFATRILIAALDKLASAMMMLDTRSESQGDSWARASRRLVDSFCQRIPEMKEIVRCYKGIPAENILHKALASRLLQQYYEVIPQVALAANFDVSPLLASALKSFEDKHGDEDEDEDEERETRKMRVMELENLVSIASYSPGMRWFAKADTRGDGKPLAPFTALLRLLSTGENGTALQQARQVLADVAVESQILTHTSGLRTVVRALRAARAASAQAPMDAIWSFLDNCISRCATSPIKYLDLMNNYLAKESEETEGVITSLINIAIVEQLPFAIKSSAAESEATAQVSQLVSLYLHATESAEAWGTLIRSLYDDAATQFTSAGMQFPKLGDKKCLKALGKVSLEWDHERAKARDEAQSNSARDGINTEALEEMLHTPFPASQDTSALTKWVNKSPEDWVEDGWAAALVRLLGSEHVHIRKEALTAILKMAAQLKESSYEEKMQIWLLLSEFAESSRVQVDVSPVPSALIAFAAHAVDILKNPLHPLYPKVNGFLTRSPVWALEKLPLAHDILHGEPSEDDKYYTELTWLLTYLLDGLQTPFDLGVFHKKRWFEKILSLGSNPYLRSALRTRLLRLVYRSTCIDGGSSTLITRFGLLSWLDAQRTTCAVKDDAEVYAALMRRAWETCDQERVSSWSKGGVKDLVAKVSR